MDLKAHLIVQSVAFAYNVPQLNPCLICSLSLSFLSQSLLGCADLAESGGKRQYDRDFLLGFQFMPACIQKPEGLPPISDVVLDKVN